MKKKASVIQSVRGTRDVFGSQAAVRELVLRSLAFTAKAYHFSQIFLPILEHSELYERSLGDGSDIVSKEMYTFQDKSGNNLTLRPEGTAGCIRALVQNRLTTKLPQKVFYQGDMFRYERPQRGRYREFQQFGVEFIGSDNALADVEVIAMAKRVLEELGIDQKSSLHINTLGDNQSRKQYQTALEEYLSKYQSDLSLDSVRRFERGSILRILDSKDTGDQEIIRDAPRMGNYLTPDARKRFEDVQEGLSTLNIDYQVNEKLVRGLDYYSHTAFEFMERIDDNMGKLTLGNAILAGGRYDTLVKELGGGADIGAVGWAAGVDRLSLLVEATNMLALSMSVAVVPIISATEDGPTRGKVKLESLAVAESLRRAGVKVHYCHGDGNLKKKMKEAINQFECDVAVMIGQDEVESKTAAVKVLSTREQNTVRLHDLVNFIQSKTSPTQ